jgi:hypothetical protein
MTKEIMSDDTLRAKKLSLMRDSINTVVDSLQKEKSKSIEDYKINRNKKVLQSLQSLIKVHVDTLDITKYMVCKHAHHEHFNERGLHCVLLNLDLPKGSQTIEFKRGWYNSTFPDSLYWSTFKLPVIVKEMKDD